MATATQKVSDGTTTVTRDDIEAKLREIRGDVESVGANAKQYALIAGAVVTVAVVALAFSWGKRKGKKKRTIVEVRRV
ncbi:MAG: hypothetical protein JWO68_2990 [Actinomycetia bacterium]|jgi:hypothetical protein|nr:hypothetical protein [Actinomycetes bacterium]